MPQSLTYNYIHFVTSTKYRQPFILPEIQDKFYSYIAGICTQFESHALQIGGIEDHIHILLLLSKKITLVDFVQEVKQSSSKWIKTQGEAYQNFQWQGGYGAFSVNPREIETVKKYIKNQKEHHAKKTFQEEYQAFLSQYCIEYDERYIWD